MSRYKTARALEMAVGEAARASVLDTNRAINNFYYHRLLVRVFSEGEPHFVLKGGLGMLARTVDARATRDADLTTSSLDIDSAVCELRRLASRDLGDFVSFQFVGVEPVRADDEYRDGFKVRFDAFLGGKNNVAAVESFDMKPYIVPRGGSGKRIVLFVITPDANCKSVSGGKAKAF